MFKEPAHNGDDADVVGDAGNLGAETADAADDEINFDACLACPVEGNNTGLVHKGVEFEGKVSVAVGLLPLDLAVDSCDDLFSHGSHGAVGDEEFAVAGLFRVAGQGVEEVGDVCPDVWVAGEHGEVGVDPCGGCVVVSCAHVSVDFEFVVLFAADDHAHLCMDLEADDAVDDVNSRTFKGACPFYIILLVEACFQFHQNSYGFSFFAGFHEGVDDRGVFAGPVEGLFDGEDVGVTGCGSDELDDRGEAVVGVVEQEVVLGYCGEQGLFCKTCRDGCFERDVLEVGPVDVREFDEVVHADEAAGGDIDLGRHEPEFCGEEVADPFGHCGVDFEAGWDADTPLFDAGLDGGEEVGCFVLFDLHVGVTGYAEDVGVGDLHSGEEHLDVCGDEVF